MELCFHMTAWRPYLCPKTMKRRPCLCPKPVLRELNSFLMQRISFVPINLHRCWPREWKHSIGNVASYWVSSWDIWLLLSYLSWKKNGKQISVICLIERHKDNNNRSRKKSPNLYSPDHAYAWNFERTKFRNVHRLPPVTWVTYGKNFRCVVAKWVNKLNWKKPVSLV